MSGILGAIVQFKNPSTGVVIATATTDINGAYSVSVPDGVYTVNVVYPTESGYAQSFDHVVIDDPIPANNGSIFPITGVDVTAGSSTTVSVYSNRISTEIGAPPITSSGVITNNRTDDNTVVLTIPMAYFAYNDASGNLATVLKVTSLPLAGILKYNGSAITLNQEISLTSGGLVYPITYESSQAIFLLHHTYVSFKVKTASSVDYGNESSLDIVNTAFNSTTIAVYLNTTSSQIKARSVSPDQAFIVDLGTEDVCWALLPSQVKTAIGSSGDATWDALFALAIGTGENNKINQWSNFSPTEWYLSAGVLTSRKRAVSDKRSTFAGYNHAALGPSLFSYSDVYNPGLGDTGVSCSVYLGEINWGSVTGVSKVGIKTYNGATLLGSTYFPLTAMVGEYLSLSNALNLTDTGTIVLTSELFFCDGANNRTSDIPGVSGFSTTYTAEVTIPYSLAVSVNIPNIKITSAVLNGVALNTGDVLSGVNQAGYIQPFTNGTLTIKWSGTPDHQTMTYWYDGNFRSVTMHAEDHTAGYTFNIPACNTSLLVGLVNY